MGAYIAIHPLNRISVWMGMFWGVIQVPAFIVVGLWFLLQYVAAFASLEYAGTRLGGTAHWAHLGGFLAGVGIIKVMVYKLKKRQAEKVEEEETAVPENLEEKVADDPFRTFLPTSPANKNETKSESLIQKL